MNTNQYMGVLRALVPTVVAYAVAKGWVPESASADIVAAVIAVGAAGWSVHSNRPEGLATQLKSDASVNPTVKAALSSNPTVVKALPHDPSP